MRLNSAWRRESRGSESETSQRGIAANGQSFTQHQLALTAAVVQHQMAAHITAPM